MNVIAFNKIEHDVVRKPVPTFRHHALAPLWVWFAVDEVPSWQTVVGGGIVMTGVVAQILVGHGTDRLTFVDDVKAGTG